MKQSLKTRITNHLKEHRGVYLHGGELEQKGVDWGYKASYASRECRHLARENLIHDKIIDGKVWYMYDLKYKVQVIEVRGDTAFRSFKTVDA